MRQVICSLCFCLPYVVVHTHVRALLYSTFLYVYQRKYRENYKENEKHKEKNNNKNDLPNNLNIEC